MGTGDSIPAEIRRAFLARHGGRARAIQERAWRELRSERDGVVIAPTGSGKTEAVFMPVAARLLSDDTDAHMLRILVISPTRALASDLYERMSPIAGDLGLRLDVSTSDRNTVGKSPADVVVRTPEGMDSVLCRKPESLCHLTTVVIDEIHSFVGDPRGTQLVGLLVRAQDATSGIRRIGISATVDDPEDLMTFGLLRNPVVVEEVVEGDDCRLQFFPWLGKPEQAAGDLIRKMRRLGVRKALGFAATRARVEEMCAALNRGYLRGYCVAHHAGLSARLRKEAEARFRSAPIGLMVATTTMEVGIDIGSIDTCILFDAPKTPASYRQRIGRAGRRSGERTVIVVTDLYDRRIAYAKAMGGAQEAKLRDLRPCASAVVQQVVSYLVQHGGAAVDTLADFALKAFGLERQTTEAVVALLEDAGWVARRAEELRPSAEADALLVSRQLHLTFGAGGGAVIRDKATGRALGRAVAREGDTLLLGGRGRRVTGVDPETGAVFAQPTDGGKAMFAPSSRSPFEALAQRVALVTGGKCQPR